MSSRQACVALAKILRKQFTCVCSSRGEHETARATDAFHFGRKVKACGQNTGLPSLPVMLEEDDIDGSDDDCYYDSGK